MTTILEGPGVWHCPQCQEAERNAGILVIGQDAYSWASRRFGVQLPPATPERLRASGIQVQGTAAILSEPLDCAACKTKFEPEPWRVPLPRMGEVDHA